MTKKQQVTIIVHGKVQGVFYRDSTRRKARELGLSGTVRNLPDGTVQIIAQGPLAALEKLVQWARQGPPAAAVSDLEIGYEAPKREFNDFTVLFR